MAENGNGKWQLAFWLITAICGIWLLSLTQAVVANERLRIADSNDIKNLLYERLGTIDQRLTKIETKIENARTTNR